MDQRKNYHKEELQNNGGVNPVTAAVTGAVIGASAAVAGSIALSNEKNRQKVKETLANMKDKTIEYLEKRSGKEASKAEGALKKVKKEISSAKHAAKKTADRPAIAA